MTLLGHVALRSEVALAHDELPGGSDSAAPGTVPAIDVGHPQLPRATQPPAAAAQPASIAQPPAGPGPTDVAGTGETEVHWYVGQMGIVYAASLATILGSIAANNFPAGVVGTYGLLLGPPALHIAHGNGVGIGVSLGIRAVFVLTAVASSVSCIAPFGEPPTNGNCDLLTTLASISLLATTVLDFGLARKTQKKPASHLSLLVSPSPGPGRTIVSMVGRF